MNKKNLKSKTKSKQTKTIKPIMLIILDGFGIRKDKNYNGILNANMTNYFNLYTSYPHTHLHASGPLVGLPEGQIGSSEVGHMTMGAGRLIKQPIVRINEEIKNKNFFKNKQLNKGLKFISTTHGNIHIMGLLGPGGVHSKDTHLYALLDFYDNNANKIPGTIFIHSFLDGRDTPQKSALKYLEELESKINSLKHKSKFIISTICGRYYAMDRDLRWNRTKKAYDMLIEATGKKFTSYKQIIKLNYKNKITDEFILPSILHIKPIRDEDLIMFYNFRSDRPKQIIRAITNTNNFNKFQTRKFKNLKIQTLTKYDNNFEVDVLYDTIYPKNTLGKILAKNKKTQLRISESEKFPHVTYFFNGLKQTPFQGEERIKINSPKVATYDLMPEMSAKEVCNKVIEKIKQNKYDFILLNFANSDMVGHTGNFNAVIKAMKKIDLYIGKIKTEIDKAQGLLMITSDHGNCEIMKDETGEPHTKHTYNQVPFILCEKAYALNQNHENLSLYNIAPTILEIMNIKNPKENAKSLIISKNLK